jgi:YggT family protein
MAAVATVIHFVLRLLTFLVIAQAILSYFMDPYHPARRWVDRLVSPLLAPIRRVVPPVGMVDFSPVILIVLIQLIDFFLTRLLLSF